MVVKLEREDGEAERMIGWTEEEDLSLGRCGNCDMCQASSCGDCAHCFINTYRIKMDSWKDCKNLEACNTQTRRRKVSISRFKRRRTETTSPIKVEKKHKEESMESMEGEITLYESVTIQA